MSGFLLLELLEEETFSALAEFGQNWLPRDIPIKAEMEEIPIVWEKPSANLWLSPFTEAALAAIYIQRRRERLRELISRDLIALYLPQREKATNEEEEVGPNLDF